MAVVPRWFKRLKEFRVFSISSYVQKSFNVNYSESSAMDILGSFFCLMSFLSHFRFLLFLADVVTCLALQTESIVEKITQPKLPKSKNELTKICNELGIKDEIENILWIVTAFDLCMRKKKHINLWSMIEATFSLFFEIFARHTF